MWVFALLTLLTADAGAPLCWSFTHEARFRGEAYRHEVTIRNGCNAKVRCTVSTDAAPEKRVVEVDAGASEVLMTHIASPAREFTPTVWCDRVP